MSPSGARHLWVRRLGNPPPPPTLLVRAVQSNLVSAGRNLDGGLSHLDSAERLVAAFVEIT
jgi:hypothetical protein